MPPSSPGFSTKHSVSASTMGERTVFMFTSSNRWGALKTGQSLTSWDLILTGKGEPGPSRAKESNTTPYQDRHLSRSLWEKNRLARTAAGTTTGKAYTANRSGMKRAPGFSRRLWVSIVASSTLSPNGSAPIISLTRTSARSGRSTCVDHPGINVMRSDRSLAANNWRADCPMLVASIA